MLSVLPGLPDLPRFYCVECRSARPVPAQLRTRRESAAWSVMALLATVGVNGWTPPWMALDRTADWNSDNATGPLVPHTNAPKAVFPVEELSVGRVNMKGASRDRQVRQEQGTSGTQEKETDAKQAKETQEGAAGTGKATGGDQDGATRGLSDEQLFYNPKYDDSKLPVRPVEEWTPPTPIDWSIEGVLELNFDHLKFNIQPDQPFEVRQLTLDLLKLRGRTIKIRGYIRPSFKEKNITRFVFVRDNQECCFGPGAALYDCAIVNMASGNAVNFSTRPVTVEGKFALKPFRGPDKRVWAIFEINEAVLR